MNNELQLISRRLTGLTMKRPGLALGLWGEPGIGKTHTALAFLRGIPCQTRSVHANQAFDKIMGQIPKPKKLTLWLEKILERISKGETLETGMLNQALVALLAANAPIVLHVEDLHEASIERLEFWQQLALGVVRTRGVGLMVTSRVQPPENFEAIRLSVLTREESDVLLEAEIAAKLPPEALTWLFERAAGNPLFTLEFFRLLARQGSLWNDGQRWRFRTPERETMPVTVEALIEQVLHETANTPALENAIGAKAMLGLGAIENLWAEVAGLTLEDLSVVKQELEHWGVLANAEFVHPLFREVIAHRLTANQRQGFARRALEVLKDDPRVAAEFVKDANLKAGDALGWFEEAALAAKNAGDQIQSARFKARAVEYAIGAEKGRLALEAAQGLKQFDIPEAMRLAESAFQSDQKNVEAIDILMKLMAAKGLLVEAKRLLDLMPLEERSGIIGMGRLIVLHSLSEDYAGVVDIWQAHTEVWDTNDPDVLYQISSSLVYLGDQEEAEKVLLIGLNLPNLTAEQRCNLIDAHAGLYYSRADYLKQEALSREAVSLARTSGQIKVIARTLFNLSYALESRGCFQECLELRKEARVLYAKIGDTKHYAHTQVQIASLQIQFSDYEKAEEMLLESRSILMQFAVSSFFLDCENTLASLYISWRTAHAQILVLKYTESALNAGRTLNSPRDVVNGLISVAGAETKQGRGERGLELATQALELAESLKLPGAVISAQIQRAQSLEAIGQIDMAIGVFLIAQGLAHQLGLNAEVQAVGLEIDRLRGNAASIVDRILFFEAQGLQSIADLGSKYLQTISGIAILPAQPELLQLEVLGVMQTKLESQTIPMRGRKRQELLALLLEARISGRSEVSKLELVDKLYPDADEIQANAGLRDVIYQIRSSLGENAITTTMNGYALGSLKTDVETFLETGNTQLWRGIYLEGLTLETSDTVRESLYLALRTRAEALLETDPIEVTRVGRLLCEADPYDLEALRLTVTGLRALQNHRSLTRFYDAARTRFLEIGEMLPARWQDFLTQIGTTA